MGLRHKETTQILIIVDASVAMSNETSPIFTKKAKKNYLISKNNKSPLESHRKETMIFSSLSDFIEILRAVRTAIRVNMNYYNNI